jgi:DNA invertase Pin-like site-specific DNA recombinase
MRYIPFLYDIISFTKDDSAIHHWPWAYGKDDNRPKREELLKKAYRREIDAILVWKLDRWGRPLADLVSTLKNLTDLKVGFISLTKAIDLTTPIGRALTGMLSVFAEFERDILRERIKAGIDQSRMNGKPHGRPRSALRIRLLRLQNCTPKA